MIVNSVALEYREGSSDKVYGIVKEEVGPGEFVVNFAYGRRGSTLTLGTKTDKPVANGKADQVFNTLMRSKLAKGYKVVVSEVSPSLGSGKSISSIPLVIPTVKTKRPEVIFPNLLNPIEQSGLVEEDLIIDSEWISQEKFDGERQTIYCMDGALFLCNRKGIEIPLAGLLQQEAEFLQQKFESFILDGEKIGEHFIVFDILHLEDKNLQEFEYVDRINQISFPISYPEEGIFDKTIGIWKAYTAKTESEKRKLLEILKARNAEGLVYKKADARFTSGRPSKGGNYIKNPFLKTASVICTEPNDSKRSVKMHVLDEKGNQVDIGNVTIPVSFDIPKKGTIIEVRYLYAYPAGSLFQPVYLGERKDVDIDDCTVSQLIYKESTV